MGRRRVCKTVLDEKVCSSIEWQASLMKSQFWIAARKRGEFGLKELIGEMEAKSDCLTRF